MVEESYQKALKIVEENQDKIDILAARLLEREVIFREDLEEIFGVRDFEHEHRAQAEREEIVKKRKELLQNGNNENSENNGNNENNVKS